MIKYILTERITIITIIFFLKKKLNNNSYCFCYFYYYYYYYKFLNINRVASFNQNLYGYVTENPNIKKCDYARTNICYKEGSPYCKNGAQLCTEELIKKIEAVKKE